MTYTEKLRHPLWQKRRLEILSRDRFTCTLCGDKETELHIHHKYYTDSADPWEYEDDALATHCKHCHRIVELEKDNEREVILSAKKLPYKNNNLLSVFTISVGVDGEKCVAVYLYNINNNFCDIWAVLSAQAYQKIKTLFELSEKL